MTGIKHRASIEPFFQRTTAKKNTINPTCMWIESFESSKMETIILLAS